MQNLWWVWFLGIEMRINYYNRENFFRVLSSHSTKICTLENFPLFTVVGNTLTCTLIFVQVHRLVVVDTEHHVVGVVSLSDILKFLVMKPHS